MSKYKFIVVTSHTTKHVTSAFSYLFNKHVSSKEEVLLLGNYNYDLQLPSNFSYIKRCNEDEPINNWTKTIYDAIKDINTDYFIFGLDDFFSVRPFNYEIFNIVLKYMDKTPNAVRYDFGPGIVCDYKTNLVISNDDFDIIEQCQGENYRCSTQFSIWKKNFLLSMLSQPQSPWDFENQGSEKMRNDGNQVLGTNRKFCWHWIEMSGISSRAPGRVNVLGIDLKTIQELIDLKMLNEDNLQFGYYIGNVPYYKHKHDFNFDVFKQYTGDNFEYQKLEFKYKRYYQ